MTGRAADSRRSHFKHEPRISANRFWQASVSEPTAALFYTFLVDQNPPDRNAIPNHANPPLGLRFRGETERSIVLRRAGVGVHDLAADADETGTFGPILKVLDHIALPAGDCLPREFPTVVRVASEGPCRSENTPGDVGCGENQQLARLSRPIPSFVECDVLSGGYAESPDDLGRRRRSRVDSQFIRYGLKLRAAFSWPQLDLESAARCLCEQAERRNETHSAHDLSFHRSRDIGVLHCARGGHKRQSPATKRTAVRPAERIRVNPRLVPTRRSAQVRGPSSRPVIRVDPRPVLKRGIRVDPRLVPMRRSAARGHVRSAAEIRLDPRLVYPVGSVHRRSTAGCHAPLEQPWS